MRRLQLMRAWWGSRDDAASLVLLSFVVRWPAALGLGEVECDTSRDDAQLDRVREGWLWVVGRMGGGVEKLVALYSTTAEAAKFVSGCPCNYHGNFVQVGYTVKKFEQNTFAHLFYSHQGALPCVIRNTFTSVNSREVDDRLIKPLRYYTALS